MFSFGYFISIANKKQFLMQIKQHDEHKQFKSDGLRLSNNEVIHFFFGDVMAIAIKMKKSSGMNLT